MPHDSKGQPLAKGDLVIFRAITTDVFANESDCNANFAIEIPGGVPETYGPILSCNTRLCEKVTPGHPELHAAIRTAAIHIDPATAATIKAGLLDLLEKCGPVAVETGVSLLEKLHPDWTLPLEAVKLAVTQYIAGLGAAGA